MSNKHPIESIEPSSFQGNWYLTTVRAKKRELFLKYLAMTIQQNQLQELILAVKVPQEQIYENIILLNLSNFKAASTQLQKIENFQSIERKPLNIEQVNRMLRAN
jgi:hypothetical protein